MVAPTAEERAWLERVRAAPVGRLATRGPGDRLDLVPFVYAWLPGAGPYGRLVSAVDHKPKAHGRLQRFENVAAHPEVTVLVDHYEDDWAALWWVRLRGSGREVMGEGSRAEAIDALVAKYRHYRERAPTGAVLAVEVTSVTGWSGSGSGRGSGSATR